MYYVLCTCTYLVPRPRYEVPRTRYVVPGTCTCIILVRSCGCQIQIIYENGGESIVCRVFLQGLFLGNGSCNLRYPPCTCTSFKHDASLQSLRSPIGQRNGCMQADNRRLAIMDHWAQLMTTRLEQFLPVPTVCLHGGFLQV